MAQIHPSAIIEGDVKLADDVKIGPGCVLRGPIEIGPGCELVGHVYLVGPVRMGAGNRLYPHVCVGFEPQSRRLPDNWINHGVVLGERNILREGATIHGSTQNAPTRMGNNNFLMANSHLGHDVQLGDNITLANGVLLGGHVEVANNVVMGGNAAVHQFCRVGRLAMLGGTCGITQDLPPFCTYYIDILAIGSLNSIGLRRNGFEKHIEPLKHAFDILFREGHTNRKAVEKIRAEVGTDALCTELADFVASSRRGICPYRSARSAGE